MSALEPADIIVVGSEEEKNKIATITSPDDVVVKDVHDENLDKLDKDDEDERSLMGLYVRFPLRNNSRQ